MKDQRVQRLYDLRKLKTDEDCEQFNLTLEEIFDGNEKACIRDLFHVFDDESKEPEIMMGLVRLLEDIDGSYSDTYLQALADSTADMILTAKNWAEMMHRRLLQNHDRHLAYTRKFVWKLDDPHREAVIYILNDIKRRFPEGNAKKLSSN